MTTVEVDYPPGLELVIAWLLPLGVETRPGREPDDLFPSRMVSVVAGTDDHVTEHGIYQVDDFFKGATKREALRGVYAQSRLTRRRMLALGPPLAPQRRVTISTGTAFADSVGTSVIPTPLDYGDDPTVQRMVSRYVIDLRVIAA